MSKQAVGRIDVGVALALVAIVVCDALGVPDAVLLSAFAALIAVVLIVAIANLATRLRAGEQIMPTTAWRWADVVVLVLMCAAGISAVTVVDNKYVPAVILALIAAQLVRLAVLHPRLRPYRDSPGDEPRSTSSP